MQQHYVPPTAEKKDVHVTNLCWAARKLPKKAKNPLTSQGVNSFPSVSFYITSLAILFGPTRRMRDISSFALSIRFSRPKVALFSVRRCWRDSGFQPMEAASYSSSWLRLRPLSFGLPRKTSPVEPRFGWPLGSWLVLSAGNCCSTNAKSSQSTGRKTRNKWLTRTVAATHRVVIEIALPNTKPFWQHKFQMDYQKTKITFEYYLWKPLFKSICRLLEGLPQNSISFAQPSALSCLYFQPHHKANILICHGL